jgi:multidrug resistance efflux pump
MHNLPKSVRLLVPIAIVLALGIYYGLRALTSRDPGALSASGTIEAVVVSISPEIGGRVSQVTAEEGQPVFAGDILLSLDEALLAGQQEVAAAALEAAQAAARTAQSALETATTQYQIALEAALSGDAQARVSDWFTDDVDQFDQPTVSAVLSRSTLHRGRSTQLRRLLQPLSKTSSRLVLRGTLPSTFRRNASADAEPT